MPIADGYLSFEGGIDSGLAPILLSPNQLSFTINATQRGGFVGPRPGFKQCALDFSEVDQSAFEDHKFQGAGTYLSDGGIAYLAVSICGRIFTINLNAGCLVEEITPTNGYVLTAEIFVSPAINANVVTTLTSTTELVVGTTYTIDGGNWQLVSIDGLTVTLKNLTYPAGYVVPAMSILYDGGDAVENLDENSCDQPKAWFQQAENWLVIQDNQSAAILWNGLTARRALPGQPNNEVPTGGPMAYGKGRLWVAYGSLYYGGDLVWSDETLGRDSVIKFTENTFLAEGGAFAVPSGPITGLSFAANLDTSLGDGDLLVFTADNIFAFSAPIDRVTWSELQYPIQRFALLDYGSLNHDGIVRVNGDLFYRREDGFGSLIYARRDFMGWGNAPIGREVSRLTDRDARSLLYAGSGVYFGNRFLGTVGPYNVQDHGVYHGGLVSLNLDLNSSLRGKSPPAWEGVWTGLRFLKILKIRVNSVERCYCFVLSTDNKIQLWELTTNARFDFDGEDDIPIPWTIETKGFSAAQPAQLKRLSTADFWIGRLAGQLDCTVTYRNERSDQWMPWASFSACAEYRDCEEPECSPPDILGAPRTFREQGRTRIGLPECPDQNDPFNGGLRRDGMTFQLKLAFVGHCQLPRMRVVFEPRPDGKVGDITGIECDTIPNDQCQIGCRSNEYCDEDPYEYQITEVGVS